jgi:DNA invertase Pin-like site-specific DNA recombinase
MVRERAWGRRAKSSDANRPQYRAMLEAAARHDFEVLIVDDLWPLTRDSVECERAIRRLGSSGLQIVATSDGYDWGKEPTGTTGERGLE